MIKDNLFISKLINKILETPFWNYIKTLEDSNTYSITAISTAAYICSCNNGEICYNRITPFI
jgi:hypothetical protein